MITADTTKFLAKSGSVLTGRSALNIYGLYCSSDPNCIMVSSNVLGKDYYCNPIWILPIEDENEIIYYKDIKITTKNRALYDLFKYEYDDSVLFEVMDCLENYEIIEFVSWMKEHLYTHSVLNKFLNDNRWYNILKEVFENEK